MKLPVRYYKNFPKENPIGHFKEVINLNIKNTALLIVDVYGKGFEEGERDESNLPGIYVPERETEAIVTDLIQKLKNLLNQKV